MGRWPVEAVLRGDLGQGTGLALAALAADQRERGLRDYWRKEYSFVEPGQVDARWDPVTGEERLTMTGTATLDWRDGWYETDGTDLGYRADFHRDPGPHRDAPFAVPFPLYTRTREEITLPTGFHDSIDKARTDVDRTIAGVTYRRTAELKNGAFTIEASERSIQPEFPAADAPAAQVELRRLADQNVFLHRPNTLQPTAAELDATLKTMPTTAAGFLHRADALNRANRFKEAIADLSSAVALDPGNADAYADRAFCRVELAGDGPEVQHDLAAAEAIQPRNPMVLRARGLLAAKRGDDAATIDFMSRSLEIDPGNDFALSQRANALRRQGKTEAALVDVEAVIQLHPQEVSLRLQQLNLLIGLGRRQAVLDAIAAMLAANPKDGYAHVVAGRFLAELGDRPGAMAQFAQALAIEPEAYIYLNRAGSRPAADVAGRRADTLEAARLDPKNPDIILALAALDVAAGNHAGALARLAPLVAAEPRNPALLAEQGIAQSGAGQMAAAERSFAAARTAAAGNPQALNDLCWRKATHGVALTSALQDCDAAVAKAPTATYLDSRGFVNLRLGRLDAALQDYDAALAKRPADASSLMGRSLTHARRGETAAAAADRQAAMAADALIVDTFAAYGMPDKAAQATTQAAPPAPPDASGGGRARD